MSFKFLFILPVILSHINGNPIKGGQNVGYGKVLGSSGIVEQPEFPFMAHLRVYRKVEKGGGRKETVSRCGSVIISSDKILTAGHCFACKKNAVFSVHAGFMSLKTNWRSVPWSWIKDYIVNEGYVPRCDISENLTVFALSDIAIGWLESPFVLGTTVQKALLNTFDGALTNLEGWIVGWGQVAPGESATTLQKAAMTVISNKECNNIHTKILIPHDMFCVISKTKSATICPGDSGGPFVSGNVVYGITSFAQRSCNAQMPQMYIHIAMYREWIEEKIKENRNLAQNSLKQLYTSFEDDEAINLSCSKRFKNDEHNNNENEVLKDTQ